MLLDVYLLRLHQVPIFQQLQIEEALLRIDNRNWCILNSQVSPAVILGISGKREEHLHEDKLTQHNIPVIRRFSGGGTVVVDQSTCFVSFIFNTKDKAVAPFPVHIMEWTAGFYAPLFPFRLRDNDYVIGDRKCGGNAQCITKDRWLHHSTFLWDYDPHLMGCLQMPSRTPAYRQQRSHSDFLCTLKECAPSPEHFNDRIEAHLMQQYRVRHVTQDDVQEVLRMPHRQSTCFLN